MILYWTISESTYYTYTGIVLLSISVKYSWWRRYSEWGSLRANYIVFFFFFYYALTTVYFVNWWPQNERILRIPTMTTTANAGPRRIRRPRNILHRWTDASAEEPDWKRVRVWTVQRAWSILYTHTQYNIIVYFLLLSLLLLRLMLWNLHRPSSTAATVVLIGQRLIAHAALYIKVVYGCVDNNNYNLNIVTLWS